MPVSLPDARPRGVLPGAGAKLPRQQEGAQVFLKELGWNSCFEALWL
jgi:hypothetical protein